MKMVTLERIAACLENESPEVVIDEQVRRAAERSIRRMIEIGCRRGAAARLRSSSPSADRTGKNK